MWKEQSSIAVALAVVIQVIAILVVLEIRLSGDRPRTYARQLMWIAAFLFVAGVSLIALQASVGCCLAFATTLPLMAVGATMQLGRNSSQRAF